MRFAIIASPRTGSGHLTDLLNSRPDILCNGEICHSQKVFVHWRKTDQTPERLAELAELRSVDASRFLERIFEINYDRPNVGFKILRGQQKHVFNSIIEDRTIKKVILFRRNVLANYSSNLIASETRVYALNSKTAAQRNGERSTVRFDADEFVVFRRKYERFYASTLNMLLKSGQSFHVIDYEAINNRQFFFLLLSFLGADLRHPVLEGRLAKQNPSDILSRFSNPKTVEAYLREHGLPHWCFEGQVSFDFQEAPGGSGERAMVRNRVQ